VVLEGGGGLLGLALNGFFWLALQIVALWGAVRAAGMPPPARGSGDDLGVLVRFGVRLHLSQLLAQFLRSDRLLLGVLGVPTEAIARYQFGAGVAERLGGVVGELTSAVPGAVADLDRRGDHGRVVQIFLRSLRINAVAGFFLFGFLACFSREILTVWLGSSYPSSAEVLRICTAGALAAVLGSPVLAVLAALGHPGRIALSYATGVAGAGVLYIAWGRRYDVRGLAACLSLGWILVQAAAASGLRRRLEVRWREVAGNALLRPWIVLLPSAVALGVVRALGVEAGVRGEALTVVLPAFLGAALLAWPLARFSGAIGKGDVEVIRSLGRRPTA
jgi:O-antigen/teichoic acid export membrane protein